MALTLILGDQLHREGLEASPLQLRAGQPVLMIEGLAVASAYRYHRLRLLHTFVAMRSFRDALLERGIAVRYYELPASLAVICWRSTRQESNSLPAVAEPMIGRHPSARLPMVASVFLWTLLLGRVLLRPWLLGALLLGAVLVSPLGLAAAQAAAETLQQSERQLSQFPFRPNCAGNNQEIVACLWQRRNQADLKLKDLLRSPALLEQWRSSRRQLCAKAAAREEGGSISPLVALGCENSLNNTLIEQISRPLERH